MNPKTLYVGMAKNVIIHVQQTKSNNTPLEYRLVDPNEESKIDRIRAGLVDSQSNFDDHEGEYWTTQNHIDMLDREAANTEDTARDTGELGRDEEFARVSEKSKIGCIRAEIEKYGLMHALEIIDRISKE